MRQYRINFLTFPFFFVECDNCPNPVYICHPDSGRCVCPPKSYGPDCQFCAANTWNWEYKKGCIDCDCNRIGSIGQSCDVITGQCMCREGFTGVKCDQCTRGYYGYPNCHRCECDVRGTRVNTDGTYTCNEVGECTCKSNVRGAKCNQCLETTFGLAYDNIDGCLPCFCFGRSEKCTESDLTWGQVRVTYPRALTITYLSNFHFTKQYEPVRIIHNDGRQEIAEVQSRNGLMLLPNTSGNATIGSYVPLHAPFYFQLPKQFLGDKVKSYGGYLKFTITSLGCETPFNANVLEKYPLVQIHSHDSYILEHRGVSFFYLFLMHFHSSVWKVLLYALCASHNGTESQILDQKSETYSI